MTFISRYAKACVPLLLTASAVVERLVATGQFDRISAGAVAAGMITALGVALTANAPAK